MSGTPYQQGNPVSLDATFLNGTTPTDPSTVTFKIRQPDGSITSYVFGTDMNVTKLEVGVYECALGVPTDAGQYHYEAVGAGDLVATLPGEFFVVGSSVDIPAEAPGPVMGPCRTWINGEDLGECPGIDLTTQAQLADAVAVEASMLMYELSGRQFSGLCDRTVRPCATNAGCWPYNWGAGIYSWWGFGNAGWGWYGGGLGFGWGWGDGGGQLQCGCQPLSRVKLAGYPVREIVEVTIDGTVLPATDTHGNPNYRLDGWQWLTRMWDPSATPPQQRRWPACQDLGLDATQPGTWQVEYRAGNDPPPLGIEAAKQIACQMYLAINGKACQLPAGASTISKQGVTVNRSLLSSWGIDPKTKAWNTGLVMVDAFLAGWNPSGLRRRPAVFSPDIPKYSPRVGNT